MTATRESECSVCPDYVVRCAHLEERRVGVTQLSEIPSCHCHSVDTSDMERWYAYGPVTMIRSCEKCKGPYFRMEDPRGHGFDTLADAETDFIRREALMLSEA